MRGVDDSCFFKAFVTNWIIISFSLLTYMHSLINLKLNKSIPLGNQTVLKITNVNIVTCVRSFFKAQYIDKMLNFVRFCSLSQISPTSCLLYTVESNWTVYNMLRPL